MKSYHNDWQHSCWAPECKQGRREELPQKLATFAWSPRVQARSTRRDTTTTGNSHLGPQSASKVDVKSYHNNWQHSPCAQSASKVDVKSYHNNWQHSPCAQSASKVDVKSYHNNWQHSPCAQSASKVDVKSYHNDKQHSPWPPECMQGRREELPQRLATFILGPRVQARSTLRATTTTGNIHLGTQSASKADVKSYHNDWQHSPWDPECKQGRREESYHNDWQHSPWALQSASKVDVKSHHNDWQHSLSPQSASNVDVKSYHNDWQHSPRPPDCKQG